MTQQRKYDKEFKLDAIKLYKESGKTCDEVAKSLGIPKSTLYTWALEYQDSGDHKPCHEELSDVKMERDILKKAVAIFSPPKG